MPGILEDALKAVLDGMASSGGIAGDAAARLKKLGLAAPPAARPAIDRIFQKIDEIPTDLGVDTGTGAERIIKLVKAVGEAVDTAIATPASFAAEVADYGAVLVSKLPKRLVDYVMITQAQKRVPLVAGLMRFAGVFYIDPAPPAEPPGAPDWATPQAPHEVDLQQLMLLFTDPVAALRWGQMDFKAEAVVYGLEDIVRAISGQGGNDDARLRLSTARELELLPGRALPGDSPAAIINVPGDPAPLRMAGLHEKGLTVVPFAVSLNLGNGQLIKNLTGFDPGLLNDPGIWIAPDGVKLLAQAGAKLPGGSDG